MKLNDDTVNKLKEAFAIGADVSAACFYAEISRQTFYNWCEENTNLKEEFDRLREKPVLKAYQTIAKNLDNVDIAKWLLEKRRKNEFGTAVDITSGNKPIPILTYVQGHNSNPQDSGNDKEDQGGSGWNVGEQDRVDSTLPDNAGAV
jgi:hypothetical protein